MHGLLSPRQRDICCRSSCIFEVSRMPVQSSSHDYEQVIRDHTDRWLTPETLFDLRTRFERDGFTKVADIVPPPIKAAVKTEVSALLDSYSERRDLLLKTTGNTPRF